ncbi:MAG: hypothetical protein A2Z96_02720 [Spirochaetes bacterium GWB1_48_6]|nr:MAG: hypothetical protein A2Z96_02720 [Spirochaetes bacterium GWB1_48_6]
MNFRTLFLPVFAGIFFAGCGSSATVGANPRPSDPWVESTLAAMTPEEKAGQILITHFHSLPGDLKSRSTFNKEMARIIREVKPGGILFFAENFVTSEQTRALTQDLQNLSKIPLFLAADEEGGRVARLGRKPAMGVPNLPSARKLGLKGADAVESAARDLGRSMRALGLNMNLGPVADLDTVVGNPLGDRAFSSDPKTAGLLAAAFVQGLQSQGILAVAKHFPGLGVVSLDPHFALPSWKWNSESFLTVESIPFRAVAEASGIMVAHLEIRGLENETVLAPWSRKLITGILREDWGYEGLVMTDALNMGAVQGTLKPGDETLKALLAGADLVLMPPNPLASVKRIVGAVKTGELDQMVLDRAVRRILNLKNKIEKVK